MNTHSSTNSLQTSNQLTPALPSEQSVDLALNDCTWSIILPINPTEINEKQHDAMTQPQQQLTSLSYTTTNNQDYRVGELFSPVDNSDWKIYADTTMNLAANHSSNTHPPLYDYAILSGSSTNDHAITQSHGIFSPQPTTCFGMEKKIQDFVSTSGATTTPALCNNIEDGITLADGTSSSCTSSVVEDTYFSDGELGVNSTGSSSMVGHLSKTQPIDRGGVPLEQDISSSTQNGAPDYGTATLQEHDIADQEQESHCCRWANCTVESTTLEELIGHIRDVHIGSGKAAYHCEWIGCTRNRKPFMKRHKMHNHMRTHTGERPFECTVDGCEKRFSRPDSLNTHMRTHSNIRPYMCPVENCNKAYFHSRSLRKHVKGHEAAGIVVPRSTPNSKRKQSVPKPTPSPPTLKNEQQPQEDSIIQPPISSTIVSSSSSTPPPLLSSSSDSQFLLFNSPSSPPPEWDPSLPYTSAASLFANPIQQQQPALLEYPSTFPIDPSYSSSVQETPVPMCIYNSAIIGPDASSYTDMPLKPSSNPGAGPLYPNPSCSFYDPLPLSYAYAPH